VPEANLRRPGRAHRRTRRTNSVGEHRLDRARKVARGSMQTSLRGRLAAGGSARTGSRTSRILPSRPELMQLRRVQIGNSPEAHAACRPMQDVIAIPG
jgi:hypothetical protein